MTTIQALIAMYEFNKLRGKDRFGWVLLHSAIEMGYDLGLYIYPGAEADMTNDLKFARNFTAWSIYNYQAYVKMSLSPFSPSKPHRPSV